jgi:hypothetical protein
MNIRPLLAGVCSLAILSAPASSRAASAPQPPIWYLAQGSRPAAIIGPLPHIKHGPVLGLTPGFDATSTNWAGYVDVVKAPRPGPELEAVLVVPQFDNHDSKFDMISFWTGFDGFNNNHILQAGVDCFIDGSNRSNNGCYTFAEYYPDATIGLFNVSIGDVIGLFSFHEPDGSGGGFYVFNWTNGDVAGVANNFFCNVPACPSADPYTGDSAEWIVEAPQVNGQLAPLVQITQPGGVEIYNDIMLSFNGRRDRYPYDRPNKASYRLSLVQNGVTAAVPHEISPFSFGILTYP